MRLTTFFSKIESNTHGRKLHGILRVFGLKKSCEMAGNGSIYIVKWPRNAQKLPVMLRFSPRIATFLAINNKNRHNCGDFPENWTPDFGKFFKYLVNLFGFIFFQSFGNG